MTVEGDSGLCCYVLFFVLFITCVTSTDCYETRLFKKIVLCIITLGNLKRKPEKVVVLGLELFISSCLALLEETTRREFKAVRSLL